MIDEAKSKRNLYLRRRHRRSESDKSREQQTAKDVTKRSYEPKPKQKAETQEPPEKPVESTPQLSRLEEMASKVTTFIIHHLKM